MSNPPNAEYVRGTDLIAAERERQVTVEGWTPEHDDEHDSCELAAAATSYVLWTLDENQLATNVFWPWDPQWWKPSADPVRNLVKAGALIAAEIDRLQRAHIDGFGAGVDRE